ncbi:hypothetical protein VNI00_009462 [Paramarasmius palmivorus]|uniref:Glycosyltransferase family 25 protein n=1 Tax=Paramarasmius palmivorus TaxID=297713 RepID=A0AAW0CP82_9AGAR
MEILRGYMGLRWEYIIATGYADNIVATVMRNVERLREWVVGEVTGTPGMMKNSTVDSLSVNFKLPFRWPAHLIPAKPKSPRKGATKEVELLLDAMDNFDIYQQNGHDRNATPLVVSKGDFTLTVHLPTLRRHMILSPARVACWHSHLQTIQTILDSSFSGISIIFEDDIDMEIDIRRRLRHVWNQLPDDWDIVFLGHCWSNETRYDALGSGSGTFLHPSYAPQCTHAYALSPLGARRLHDHLTYPPFAYSRAIDQAYAWLVKSGRLKSFSIVPGVVIQRRAAELGWYDWVLSWWPWNEVARDSDVWKSGSRWKDKLHNGVFGAMRVEKGIQW